MSNLQGKDNLPLGGALNVPVVIIAFNRPATTNLVFERVRDARPRHLFLFVDGPRAERPSDSSLCHQVHAILDNVDWPCEVARHYSDVNLGCNQAIRNGLDAVFREVSQAIILEDDCVPDASFFPFCQELLERYEDDPRVMSISGHSHFVPTRCFGGASYALTAFSPVWGWATWRRAWALHQRRFPETSVLGPMRDGAPFHAEDSLLQRRSARNYFRHFERGLRSGNGIWDSQWWLTILAERGFGIMPAVNLVENIGIGTGSDATHTRTGASDHPSQVMSFPLSHPAVSDLNVFVERELEITIVRSVGRMAMLMRRVIPPGPGRSFARIFVNLIVRNLTRVRARFSPKVELAKRNLGNEHGRPSTGPCN